jgi:putative chitinase
MQTTGFYNYLALTQYSGVDFINAPEKVAQLPYCVLSAVYYWDVNKLNQFADKDDFHTITVRINGGVNGYDERLMYLNRAKKYLKI